MNAMPESFPISPRLLAAAPHRLLFFVGATNVLAAMLWAWVLVAELPTAWQAVGGASVLAGVVVVKLGEPTASGPPAAAGTPR